MDTRIRRMRNLLACLLFVLALIVVAGLGQIEVEKMKEGRQSEFGASQTWSEKTSMKYETIGYDWSDEEPMIQELLLEPVDIRPVTKGLL